MMVSERVAKVPNLLIELNDGNQTLAFDGTRWFNFDRRRRFAPVCGRRCYGCPSLKMLLVPPPTSSLSQVDLLLESATSITSPAVHNARPFPG